MELVEMRAQDWILLAFITFATIPFLFANIVIFRYRKRKYFRAQGGVEFILLGSLAGLLFISSAFVTNGHIPHREGIFAGCIMWEFWIKLCLGLSLWLVCITMRLHRMENILKNGENPSWTVYFFWVPVLMLPSLVICTVATVAHAMNSGHKCECESKRGWRETQFFTIPPIYFSGVLIYLFKLRKQKDLLVRREYMHTCDYCIMSFLVYVLTGVSYLTGGYEDVEGRCFLTFCVCCVVFFHFWVHMAWPVYLCLFKPESEMETYEEELRQSGARILNCFVAASGHMNVPSSEGAILHAIHEASEEISEFKEKISILEMEKSRLEAANWKLKQCLNNGKQALQVELSIT